MDREVKEVICSCGGTVREVDPTAQEEKDHGCGITRCCVQVWQCQQCKVRWMFAFAAPDFV